MRLLFHLLLLAGLSALAGAAWVAHRPAQVAEIPVLPQGPKDPKPRDVLDDLRQAAIKRSAIVEISERDLNRHLAASLSAKVRAPMGQWVKFERVYLDLEADVGQLTVVWNVHGRRSTVTVDLRIRRSPDSFRVEVTGGGYGQLRVPRGMLRPLAPMLRALSQTLEEDIEALFQMNKVTIAKDKLVLDPRFL